MLTPEQIIHLYKQWSDTPGSTHADLMQAAYAQALKDAAEVCQAKALHCEKKAQEAIDSREHDEVSAIRSTAWQISVCAAAILALGKE